MLVKVSVESTVVRFSNRSNNTWAGSNQDKANKNLQQHKETESQKMEQIEKEEAAKKAIKELEERLEEAKNKVAKAQQEVERLQKLPAIPEPDFAEAMLHAETAVPESAVPQRGKMT